MPIRSFLYSHCKLCVTHTNIHVYIYICAVRAHTHIIIYIYNICKHIHLRNTSHPSSLQLPSPPLCAPALWRGATAYWCHPHPHRGAWAVQGRGQVMKKSDRSTDGSFDGVGLGGISTCPNISKHKVPQLSMLLSGFEWFRILLNSIFPIEIATCSR